MDTVLTLSTYQRPPHQPIKARPINLPKLALSTYRSSPYQPTKVRPINLSKPALSTYRRPPHQPTKARPVNLSKLALSTYQSSPMRLPAWCGGAFTSCVDPLAAARDVGAALDPRGAGAGSEEIGGGNRGFLTQHPENCSNKCRPIPALAPCGPHVTLS